MATPCPLNQCTFRQTGLQFVEQNWRRCYDCLPNKEDEGVCLICAELCHDGHRLGPLMYTPFYCDCVAKKYGCFDYQNKILKNTGKDLEREIQNKTKQVLLCNREKEKKRAFFAQGPPSHCVRKLETAFPLEPDNKMFDKKQKLDEDILFREMADCTHNLATKLYSVLPSGSVFSPHSLAYALSILYQAASGNTSKEIERLLSIRPTTRHLTHTICLFNDEVVSMTNLLLVNQNLGLEAELSSKMNDIVDIKCMDFRNPQGVARRCNEFIEKNTEGLIKRVISPETITADSALLLVNTIYFKAVWSKKFNKKGSTHDLFHSGQTDIIHPFMTQVNFFPYYEDQNVQILEMLFEDRQYCMGFMLHNKHSAMPSIQLEHLKTFIARMDTMVHVKVKIPKFTHRQNISMKQPLCTLGLRDIFDPLFCNLEKICHGAFISDITHEAIFTMEEDCGNEPAGGVSISTFAQVKPKEFIADRPFIFYIRHISTNTILFIGDYHGQSH